MSTVLSKRLAVGALGLALCACGAQSNGDRAAGSLAPRPIAPNSATATSGGAKSAIAITQQVRFMGDTLAVSLPGDMQLQMESLPNLKSYGTHDRAVLLATAKVPDGLPADPKVLLDQTEANLKRQDPSLTVLRKGELQTAGRYIVQSLAVLTHLPERGEVFSFYAIGVKGDQIVTITQVMPGSERRAYQPQAEAIVRSLVDIK